MRFVVVWRLGYQEETILNQQNKKGSSQPLNKFNYPKKPPNPKKLYFPNFYWTNTISFSVKIIYANHVVLCKVLILGNYVTSVPTPCVPKIQTNNNGKLIDSLTCSSEQNHELLCIPKITKAKTTKFGHPHPPIIPPPSPLCVPHLFVLPQKCTYHKWIQKIYLP